MSPLNEDTMYEALFASDLQPSQHPGAGEVRAAISRVTQALTVQDCTERVAQEFGDHPETAIMRMRWVREAVSQFQLRG
jgi:hypothetical protein